MIILPPEEPKKASPLIKWTFRILLLIVLIGCFGLFSLNLLSGTTDAHKHGLERAFSNMFKAPVTIGELRTFNIFPKILIEMKNVSVPKGPDAGEVRVEALTLGFRFFDVLLGRDLIENLQVTNLTMTSDIMGPYGLRIEKAGIVPATDGHVPAFTVKGAYGGLPVFVSLDLQNVGGYQPVYRVEKDFPAEFHLGSAKAVGKFTQNDKGEPSIYDASFKIDDQEIAKGALTFQTFAPHMGVKLDFQTPLSAGQWIGYTEDDTQSWSFDRLDLAEVISSDAVWARVAKAIHKPALPSRNHELTEQVAVSIKSLNGDVSGHDLQGHFILKSGRLAGWWNGTLSALPEAKKKVPPSGDVKCGLLSMGLDKGIWVSDVALVHIGDTTLSSTLRINAESGKTSFEIDRLANGTAQTFGKDLSEFKAEKSALVLPEDHSCDGLIGVTATP